MAMAERCAGALICLTVVLLAAGTVRSAASNGTTTNSPGNGTTSQPTQSTIEFWYSLEQRFMDTVQPKKLSVDYVKSLYDSIVNKTFQTSDISTLFKKPEVVGILTLVILGVLYSAGILIGGLIFCLVQCCCSGYQKYDEDGAKCSRCTMSFFLVAFCVLISFGTGMLAVSLTDVIRTSDSLPPFVNTTFTSFHRVIATTESEIDGVVRGGFEKVAADVLSNLNRADRTLSASIYNSLDRNVTATISGIEELGNSVTTVSSSVGNVTSDFTKMNDDLKEARDGLEIQRRQWTDFCGSPSGSAVCQGSGVDFTAVVLPTNYVLSFESATVLTNLEEIQRTNLSSLADKAKTSYNSVPQQIRDKIPPIRQKVDRTFGDVRQRIQEELRKLHAETVKLNEQILPVRNDAYEYARQPQKYHDYIFYSVIAISVFFGLFAALVLLGTCVGGAAYNSSVIPTRRKVCSRAGGCCLIAVVYLTLITAWLFMLLTTALFVVSTQADSAVCPLLEGEADNFTELQKLVDLFELPASTANQTIDLFNPKNLTGILLGCKRGATFYTSFHLDSVFDLNQLQKHLDNANIQSQLGDFQLDERNIEIFSLDSERQTRNFITQLENIKLNTTLDELSQTDTTSSFSGIANLARSVENLANATGGAAASDLNRIAVGLKALSTGPLTSFEEKRKNLATKGLPTMQTQVAATKTKANEICDSGVKARTEVPKEVTASVNAFANAQAKYGQDFVDLTKLAIRNDVGKCKPLYDVYDDAVTLLCRDTLPALNGIWFSLGLILLTLLPTVIVSGCLAKHYRRATKTNVHMETGPRRQQQHPIIVAHSSKYRY